MSVQKQQLIINQQLAASFGLNEAEYQKLLEIMGREPNITELGIFSVMWSEHCSYKSTRIHLKKLHTTAPWVICGPGENAGVIDIGDNLAAIFKIESHNHPSFIEPYQGAATGVGGILRDVFTMGARPIALLNALRFGSLDNDKTRHLLAGVVAGIGGYGNCMGVPTVGGECNFHKSYNGNILVNAMCVGIAKQDKIFYSSAPNIIGCPVVYVGAKTGRDGIHGATMASTEFDDESESRRPTVQVGDPFTEKLVMEACLELMAEDAILSIQDMGAAGLTCSSLEMADKSHSGIELNLDKVPMREANMTPYEIMLSESQERMLMIIKPEKEQLARSIFAKWEVDFAVIGKITDSKELVLKAGGNIVAQMPIPPLSDQAPLYDRPYKIIRDDKIINYNDIIENRDIFTIAKILFACPDLASKSWIYQQYDSQVMNDTILGSGGDAAILRIHESSKALAITTDCTPRYCKNDPVMGGRQAVAEAWRNITAVGGQPLAVTNCLNFGNPQKEQIMGQIVGCLEGMNDACKALDFPIISGNVSLYNETNGDSINPTPTIGGVGILHDYHKKVTCDLDKEGLDIITIGNNYGHLGSSIYMREIHQIEHGAPPEVDLLLERKNGDLVRGLIKDGLVAACHDISDGGLLIALFEMGFKNNIGVCLEISDDMMVNQNLPNSTQEQIPLFAFMFGEDQARYIIACDKSNSENIIATCRAQNVACQKIGVTINEFFSFKDQKANICDVREIFSSIIGRYMQG